MVACAAYSLSASLVPMYEQQLSKDWQYILNDSAATVLFCSTQNIFERVNKEVLPFTSHVHSTLCLDATDGEVYGYQAVLKDVLRSTKDKSSATIIEPSEEDIANLIYTSGTCLLFAELRQSIHLFPLHLLATELPCVPKGPKF